MMKYKIIFGGCTENLPSKLIGLMLLAVFNSDIHMTLELLLSHSCKHSK